mmetsp:Transcript_1712/g.3674  ORF Transcript_1712/g.3674 Transcript_1712/m.3674 type:complete len:513 (+) Transcript_1712:66-1604(+)
MADTYTETSNMDNLPTPPKISEHDRSSAEHAYMDSRGSPHSIDYETGPHHSMVTPSKQLKSAGTGRSSSPRPRSASPSEFLLRTTAARVSDGHVLEERRRSSIVIQEANSPASGKKPPVQVAPPSERLLKTTVARVSDVRAWHETRGVIKHDDDIWWEQRKPLQDASKTNAHMNVESRLFEPTTSHIYSQRKKFPARTTPDKHAAAPGSAEKSPAIPTPTPLHVAKIPTESALLRPTFNSQVKNVKNQPVPPPPPAMDLPSHTSGPQNVPSRLFSLTTGMRHAKWKSKEELAAEEAAAAAKKAAATKKVKGPSEHLITYNSSMRSSARPKVSQTLPDKRESGWNSSFKKDHIPSVEEVPPLPGQRLGGSPLRRRSDGGRDSSGGYGSSLESVENKQRRNGSAVNEIASPFQEVTGDVSGQVSDSPSPSKLENRMSNGHSRTNGGSHGYGQAAQAAQAAQEQEQQQVVHDAEDDMFVEGNGLGLQGSAESLAGEHLMDSQMVEEEGEDDFESY